MSLSALKWLPEDISSLGYTFKSVCTAGWKKYKQCGNDAGERESKKTNKTKQNVQKTFPLMPYRPIHTILYRHFEYTERCIYFNVERWLHFEDGPSITFLYIYLPTNIDYIHTGPYHKEFYWNRAAAIIPIRLHSSPDALLHHPTSTSSFEFFYLVAS